MIIHDINFTTWLYVCMYDTSVASTTNSPYST